MKLRLGEKQELFYRFNNEFDNWLLAQAGVEIRGGELWRSDTQARWNSEHCRVCQESKWDAVHRFARGVTPIDDEHRFVPIGIKNSNHCRKLASDKNVFVNGVWITKSEDLHDLGTKWESMTTSLLTCCWGGRFRNPDGGHFSFLHGRTR